MKVIVGLIFPSGLLIFLLGFLRSLAYGIAAVGLILAVSPIIGIVHGVCCLINYINEELPKKLPRTEKTFPEHENKIPNSTDNKRPNNTATIDNTASYHPLLLRSTGKPHQPANVDNDPNSNNKQTPIIYPRPKSD